MGFLQQFFLYAGLLSFLLLVTGLYRPWVVLWWRPSHTRRQVARLYGSLMLANLGGYFIMTILAR